MTRKVKLDDCVSLLAMLTDSTRVATEDQLRRFCALYPDFSAPCAAVIAKLLDRGFLVCEDVTLRLPTIEKAIFSWRPDDRDPDCLALANQLNQRNTDTPWQQLRLFWATEKATSLVGGLSGLNRQPLQVQHDLCTTEVYLRFLADRYFAYSDEFWVGEDILRREFADFFPTKMPDAAIFFERDYPIDVIEIGGVYSADDLRHIHQSYSRERFRYELW